MSNQSIISAQDVIPTKLRKISRFESLEVIEVHERLTRKKVDL